MKQTAVEFLMHHISEDQLVRAKSAIEWARVIKQAKEMEEQNYLDLIRFLRTQDKMGKSVEDLLEQFKRK